jgi:ubiquinone/menaquinone biosynthesis C-methylase UbiE
MTRKQFAPRYQKALKVHYVISEFAQSANLNQLWCLDLGCGDGRIAWYLANSLGKVIALDYLFAPVHQAHKRLKTTALAFLQADGVRLPFPDSSFDIVVCAQVYEHLAHVENLPEEVRRVLKPGGLCFFSGPNKLWFIEPHYGLPFLHWLPPRIASLYLRIFGENEQFEIRSLTYWQLRYLWRHFRIYDCTPLLFSEPKQFGISLPLTRGFWKKIFIFFLRVFYFLVPNFNWLLLKPDVKDNHP